MKLTIEPTAQITSIERAPCRLWEGHDEYGTPVKVWVRTLQPQTHDEARLDAFNRELDALPALGPGAIDYRFIID